MSSLDIYELRSLLALPIISLLRYVMLFAVQLLTYCSVGHVVSRWARQISRDTRRPNDGSTEHWLHSYKGWLRREPGWSQVGVPSRWGRSI